MHVRVIDIPPGEAPEHVRRAWVGMVLPLAPGETGPRTVRTAGVLTGPRGCLLMLAYLLFGRGGRTRGYVVEGRVAVWLLGEKDPAAAAWWRENAPHTLGPLYRFVFPEEVCQEVHAPRGLPDNHQKT